MRKHIRFTPESVAYCIATEKNRREKSKIAELHFAHRKFSNFHLSALQCNAITNSKQEQKNAPCCGKLQT